MSTKTIKIASYYEDRNGRWYVTEDRTWKVRINAEHDATAIYRSREMYRLIGDEVYNVRDRRPVSPKVPTYDKVVALVTEVRSIEG